MRKKKGRKERGRKNKAQKKTFPENKGRLQNDSVIQVGKDLKDQLYIKEVFLHRE